MALKPEEFKEALEYAAGKSPDDFESLDAFKTDFTARTVIRADAHKKEDIKGKILGSLETKLRSEFAEDLGDDASEFRKDFAAAKTIEERLLITSKAVKASKAGILEKAKSDFVAKPDDRIAKIEQERDSFKSKYEQAESQRTAALGTAQEWENKYIGFEKQSKVKELIKLQSRDVPIVFSHIVDEKQRGYAKKGFEDDFNAKYAVDLTEDGEGIVILNRSTGKKIDNPSRSGDYLGYKDVLLIEAKAAGLDKKNPAEGGKIRLPGTHHVPTSRQGEEPKSKSRRMY